MTATIEAHGLESATGKRERSTGSTWSLGWLQRHAGLSRRQTWGRGKRLKQRCSELPPQHVLESLAGDRPLRRELFDGEKVTDERAGNGCPQRGIPLDWS